MFDLTLPYLREVNFFHTVTEGRPTYLTPGHRILVQAPLVLNYFFNQSPKVYALLQVKSLQQVLKAKKSIMQVKKVKKVFSTFPDAYPRFFHHQKPQFQCIWHMLNGFQLCRLPQIPDT